LTSPHLPPKSGDWEVRVAALHSIGQRTVLSSINLTQKQTALGKTVTRFGLGHVLIKTASAFRTLSATSESFEEKSANVASFFFMAEI
jgi:hypothetical protein